MTTDQVLELLRGIGFAALVRSGNVVIPCPFAAISGHKLGRDTHPSLGILCDQEGAAWNCFSCGRRGEIHSLFERLRDEVGMSVEASLARLDQMLKQAPEEVVAQIPRYEDLFRVNKSYPVFPESWLCPYVGKIPRYLLDRGVTLDTARQWELGYDRSSYRVIFPVRDAEGALVGAVGGLTRREGSPFAPKYKNYWHRLHSVCMSPLHSLHNQYFCAACNDRLVDTSEMREGFRKSLFCYGEHLFVSQTIGRQVRPRISVIVEGPIDTLKVYQALQHPGFEDYFVLGLLGAQPSTEQANTIVRLSNGVVIPFLDNDDAGRIGTEMLQRMIGRRLRCYPVQYRATEIEEKDPGAMSPKLIREMVQRA